MNIIELNRTDKQNSKYTKYTDHLNDDDSTEDKKKNNEFQIEWAMPVWTNWHTNAITTNIPTIGQIQTG